ncbi:MAG: hypothetical protein WBR10_06805 [Candidatus Acidiferrum sp.]
MNSEWVKTEIAKARKREVREKKQVLFPVRRVGQALELVAHPLGFCFSKGAVLTGFAAVAVTLLVLNRRETIRVVDKRQLSLYNTL